MSRVQDKATTERNSRTLRELVKKPENKVCADCKRNDPRWASWNIGVFVCIRCSGIHRSMGTHISKVKSVDLDMWTPEQMANVTKWGNARANIYWEAHLKAGHVPPDHKVESFIRSKYESRRWAREGPPPEDPSVLDDATAEQSLPPPPAPQQPSQPPPPPQTAPVHARASTQSRSLLSTQQLRERPPGAASPHPPGSAPRAAPVPAPAPPKPADDIFSLDFNAPAPAPGSGSPTGSKDMKNDIMSLFAQKSSGGAGVLGAGAPPPAAGVWGAQHQPAPPAAPGGGFGAWASAPGQQQQQQQQQPPAGASFGAWGAPTQPPASNVWGAPAPTQAPSGAFDANIWGGGGGFGGGAQPAQPKDDAFGDLWSSFK